MMLDILRSWTLMWLPFVFSDIVSATQKKENPCARLNELDTLLHVVSQTYIRT